MAERDECSRLSFGTTMASYFFDLREGDQLIADEEGVELRGVDAVQAKAARALVGLAHDAMLKEARPRPHTMSIEVRDHHGPVLEAKICFENHTKAVILRGSCGMGVTCVSRNTQN